MDFQFWPHIFWVVRTKNGRQQAHSLRSEWQTEKQEQQQKLPCHRVNPPDASPHDSYEQPLSEVLS